MVEQIGATVTEIDELASQMQAMARSGDAFSGLGKLGGPLIRLLASGGPVSIEALAGATAQPVEEVRRVLADVSDVEYDSRGRIVGYGLTLRPTRHSFSVDGRRLYTWCALDTLVLPHVLGRTAYVESLCLTTGTKIRLVVGPEQVVNVEPATAVISIVTPNRPVRASFCERVQFFASPDAARPFLDQHPGALVVPVAEAHRLGLALAGGLTEQSA